MATDGEICGKKKKNEWCEIIRRFCKKCTNLTSYFLHLNRIAQNGKGKVKLISKSILIIDEVSFASYHDFNARGMVFSAER